MGAPLAVVIAALLDLLYWLGPRLTLGEAWRATLDEQLRTAPLDPTATTTLLDNITVLARVNLLQSLSGAVSLGGVWPMALSSLLAGSPDIEVLGEVIEAPSLGLAVVLVLALIVLGTLIGALYLVLIAAPVKREPLRAERLVPWTIATWGRLLALNLSLLFGALLFSLPLSFALVVANMISPALGPALVALVIVLFLLLWVYGWFTLPAIVMDGVHPVLAYWRSIQMVRRHFLAAIGILLLCFLLSLGFGELWRWIAEEAWAVPIAIVGQAFLGAALTATMMIFYETRKGSPKS